MSPFSFGRKRRLISPYPAATAESAKRLRRRVQDCVGAEDATAVLEPAALAEASAVLDDQLGTGRQLPGTVDPYVLNTVAVLHRIRAGALGSPVEERHAVGALQILVHVIEPELVPPIVRDEVAEAVSDGAELDFPTAVLRAVQGHASAVRAEWKRQHDPRLADTYVRAFARIIEKAGPDRPNLSTRLLDYAAALGARFDSRRPAADPADLREALRLTGAALAVSGGDRPIVRRAHQLRGPMMIDLDELDPHCDALQSAAESFHTLADLCDPGDPAAEEYRSRVRAVERLTKMRHR
ncbi:hypothetical protein [Actinoplanes sp. NPDC051859]|uniref:hypothetical protein n=1 Tax=Actinoplanes sp. NPDC051859 TaxID=3363909 RepID=UPI0037A52882